MSQKALTVSQVVTEVKQMLMSRGELCHRPEPDRLIRIVFMGEYSHHVLFPPDQDLKTTEPDIVVSHDNNSHSFPITSP